MLGALMLIRAQLPERGGWRTISLDSLRAGFRFVWGHAVIFPFLMMDFGANIFGTMRSLFPIYARDILAVGPQGLGLLYAASAAGSLLGAFAFSLWGPARRDGRWILFGVTIYGVCLLCFAQSRWFWLSIALLIGAGVGDTISAILRSTINQLSTPDDLRGPIPTRCSGRGDRHGIRRHHRCGNDSFNRGAFGRPLPAREGISN